MGKEKLFKGSLFGYKKSVVEATIEELTEENLSLKEKIVEMDNSFEKRYKVMNDQLENIELSKKQIADAYIVAQKNIDSLVEMAKKEVALERHNCEVENEALREMIVEKKEAVRNIRGSVQSFRDEFEKYFSNWMKNLSAEMNRTFEDLDYTHLRKVLPDVETERRTYEEESVISVETEEEKVEMTSNEADKNIDEDKSNDIEILDVDETSELETSSGEFNLDSLETQFDFSGIENVDNMVGFEENANNEDVKLNDIDKNDVDKGSGTEKTHNLNFEKAFQELTKR